jgi:hypothetical protein
VEKGRGSEAPIYQERLEILEPSNALRRAAAPSPTTADAPVNRVPAKPTTIAGAAQLPAPSTVRGKIDDDPFADSNAVAPTAAQAAEMAHLRFLKRDYPAAAKLFEQAKKQGEASSPTADEEWGYCKLFVVVQGLKQPETLASSEDCEREVRQAMALSPKLDEWGRKILAQLKDRPTADPTTFQIRHIPRREGTGWAVAETPNFRVIHNQPVEYAERVARVAEATRLAQSRKWFGAPTPTWAKRCDVVLHATAADYSQATHTPPSSPGHSTMENRGEEVVSRRIDLHCDDPNMLVGVLPHETTHVVLSGRFGPRPVPRWADEGMAVLAEPADRIDRHLRNLPMHRDEQRLFKAADLLRMDNYPSADRVGAFYAQGVSLVDFLCKEKNPQVFARFLREAQQDGYEQALERHFGYRSFGDLDQAWERAAFTVASSYR